MIKLRTPCKCNKGHFNYLYYNVNNGYVKDTRFSYPFCECNNVDFYKQCGDDEQWIGLYDKNDKEIYEKDITRDFNSVRNVVIFYLGGFCFDLASYHKVIYYGNYDFFKWDDKGKSDNIEIIGNIHEGVKE